MSTELKNTEGGIPDPDQQFSKVMQQVTRITEFKTALKILGQDESNLLHTDIIKDVSQFLDQQLKENLIKVQKSHGHLFPAILTDGPIIPDKTGTKINGKYFTTRELAKKEAVSVSTINNWIKKGHLKAVKRGRTYYIAKSDYEALIKDRNADQIIASPAGDTDEDLPEEEESEVSSVQDNLIKVSHLSVGERRKEVHEFWKLRKDHVNSIAEFAKDFDIGYSTIYSDIRKVQEDTEHSEIKKEYDQLLEKEIDIVTKSDLLVKLYNLVGENYADFTPNKFGETLDVNPARMYQALKITNEYPEELKKALSEDGLPYTISSFIFRTPEYDQILLDKWYAEKCSLNTLTSFVVSLDKNFMPMTKAADKFNLDYNQVASWVGSLRVKRVKNRNTVYINISDLKNMIAENQTSESEEVNQEFSDPIAAEILQYIKNEEEIDEEDLYDKFKEISKSKFDDIIRALIASKQIFSNQYLNGKGRWFSPTQQPSVEIYRGN